MPSRSEQISTLFLKEHLLFIHSVSQLHEIVQFNDIHIAGIEYSIFELKGGWKFYGTNHFCFGKEINLTNLTNTILYNKSKFPYYPANTAPAIFTLQFVSLPSISPLER